MSVNTPTPTAPETAAEERSELSMKLVWSGVALVVLVFGGFATPWDAISSLLENQGVGEDQASILAFVAGYTFPLTLGTFVLVSAALAGWFEGVEGPWAAAICGGVLVASGLLASWLGLGLLPSFDVDGVHGPFYVVIPLLALKGYLNTYGWALMVCSAALGIGSALQVRDWLGQPLIP